MMTFRRNDKWVIMKIRLYQMKYSFSIIVGIFLVVGYFVAGVVHAQVNVTTQFVAPSVTMVWGAETYVPPFYKGKALYVDGAAARILALPPAEFGDPSLLTYMW